MFPVRYMNLNHKDENSSWEVRLAVEKYYKKPVLLFKFAGVKRTLKLWTVPTLNYQLRLTDKTKKKGYT